MIPNSALRLYADEQPDAPEAVVPTPNASRRRIARFAGSFVPYPAFGGISESAEPRDRFRRLVERRTDLLARLAEVERELGGFSLTELRAALFMEFRGDHWQQQDHGPPPEHVGEHVRELVRRVRARMAAGDLE